MDHVTIRTQPRWTLRSRLIAMIGAPLLTAFVIMIGLQFKIDRDLLVELFRQEMRGDVQIEGLKLESEFERLEHAVAIQGVILDAGASDYLPLNSPQSKQKLTGLLTTIVQGNPFAFGACFAFDPGRLGLGSAGLAPYVCRELGNATLKTMELSDDAQYNYSRAPWFLLARPAPDGDWSEPYFDEGGGDELMTTYAIRMPASDGIPSVVATVDVALITITDRLQAAAIEAEYAFVLVSAQGRVLGGLSSSAWMKSASDFESGSFERELLDGVARFRKTGDEFVRIGGGSEWSFSGARAVFIAVPSSDWVLVGSFAESELIPTVIHALFVGPGVLLIGAVIVLVTLWRSTTRAVAPLSGIVAAIERLSTGDLSARAPATSRTDEIGVLARAFNQMGGELQVAIAARESATEQRVAVEAQVSAARAIQRLLLPDSTGDDAQADVRSSSGFPGWMLVGSSEPAREIAGDFFDWFTRGDGTIVVMIADVCGKGMAAAMMMAVSRTLVRTVAMECADPATALATINTQLIAQAPQTNFTTGILIYIDASTGSIRYANAGHPLPLLLSREGSVVEVMPPTGTVLGIQTAQGWTTGSAGLAHGESLVLFTDGVTEAMPDDADPTGMFGPLRAIEAITVAARTQKRTAPALVRALVVAVESWSHGNRHDDMTVVVVERM
ncbi:MAG: HAMP domain-containing protein [Phycisphaerales bacterium]|nr:HAMP domain-containing protein [Phycisphaerales bacterium]